MDIMDVELFTEGISEEDTFETDVNSDDYSTFEGERCGICMDVVIDRGLLDCCQHWFCFTCIDNWATITNLCPLCQNEFQLITCVPVYDTIGSNKVDEDFSRDDDWCIEGKNNTLSFPSYYIDENAVICLDGDGCKVRSGSATIGEDSNLDTSIACDSCDMWYHAFCVGFDPDGTCENSWLCPRCIANENTQKSDVTPIVRPSTQCGPQNATSECLVEAAFSGKVSVSVADAGETAVVISMVEENKWTEGPGEFFLSTIEVNEDLKSSSSTNTSNLETPSSEKTSLQLNSEAQELKPSLSRDTSFILPSISLGLSELKTDSADEAINISNGFNGVGISSRTAFDEPCQSSVNLNLGLSVGFSLPVDKTNVAEDHVAGDMLQTSISEECLLPAGKIVSDTMGNVVGDTGAKRKRGDYSDDVCPAAEDAETIPKTERKALKKKVRAEGNGQIIHLKDKADEPVSDELQKCCSLIAASRDEKLTCKSGKKNVTSDIMSIVQGTDRRRLKGLACSSPADKSSKERESAAGLRVKKILRRAAEDKESSILVQELRKEIREAVRNKSSREFGENDFDPKLLAAFRAAVAGPITEQNKKLPPLVVKAKKSMLQKGKIRENLTKKIYGIGGRRRRAWSRDCEIEFWKHRCLKITKPEKIETLKSVLNLLRKSSEGTEIKQGIQGGATTSILSRLYLADNSVFPRKDDIKPLSALKATRHPQENKEHFSTEKASTSLGNYTVKTLQMNKVSSQVGALSSDNKRNKIANVPSIKGEAASSKVHPNKCPEGPSVSSLGGSEGISHKEVIGKSDDVKTDKRKWALEVLARKTAVTGRNASQEKDGDNAMLKGNYPLVAQLPIDMRPVLAPSRHNKIPISVRQAQLYRLTEHLLRKANLPVIHRTAATEFAVADAVNIEKEVADRSNSKLVYMNLCSQELLHRSDNIKSRIATESNPSSNIAIPADTSEQATNDLSPVPVIEEALRNAGLLSDSPPNSPYLQTEEIIDDDDLSRKIREEGPNDVFEMDPHPDLDIYGDFEYDLEDEDFIGASALTVSNLQTEGESQIKVVFSTLNSDRSNNDLDFEDNERKMISEVAKASSSSECNTDGTTIVDSCLPQDPLLDEGGEEPSLAICEELYGPDKEPLLKRFPETASMKTCELNTDNMVPMKLGDHVSNEVRESSGLEIENSVVVATVGHSDEENSLSCPQAGENVPKEKISNTNIKKQADSGNSVSKKVEAYIKEHIRPLCKSGVITVERYRWAVGKTTDKVMKYHSKEKNANFLIKEGEKVKKLAEQYVETAQKDEK